MNPVAQVFFSLLTMLAFAGLGRALWRVIFDADDEPVPPLHGSIFEDALPRGRIFDEHGGIGGHALPAQLEESLCSKVLDCGHACTCALGHDQKCACWRLSDSDKGVTHCGLSKP